jgi:hypothetical protein
VFSALNLPRHPCTPLHPQELRLDGNKLSGPVPQGVGKLVLLRSLVAHTNKLSGRLPESLGQCRRLEELVLFSNRLTGPVPEALGDCEALMVCHLGYNDLQDQLPNALGKLARLECLRADHNQLTGCIPPALDGLLALRTLNLTGNQLSGPIPWSLCFCCTNLQRVYLADNQLTGPIPDCIGMLTNLEVGVSRSQQPHHAAGGTTHGCYVTACASLTTLLFRICEGAGSTAQPVERASAAGVAERGGHAALAVSAPEPLVGQKRFGGRF